MSEGNDDGDVLRQKPEAAALQIPDVQVSARRGLLIIRRSKGLKHREIPLVQEALNVIEQWNSVNGFIFSGRRGELLSNRPEDQEIAVLSLHLIQVSLALINTLLLQEVLAEDKWKASMKPEDWRGLTPLFYQHVNPYGRFTLNLTKIA